MIILLIQNYISWSANALLQLGLVLLYAVFPNSIIHKCCLKVLKCRYWDSGWQDTTSIWHIIYIGIYFLYVPIYIIFTLFNLTKVGHWFSINARKLDELNKLDLSYFLLPICDRNSRKVSGNIFACRTERSWMLIFNCQAIHKNANSIQLSWGEGIEEWQGRIQYSEFQLTILIIAVTIERTHIWKSVFCCYIFFAWERTQ